MTGNMLAKKWKIFINENIVAKWRHSSLWVICYRSIKMRLQVGKCLLIKGWMGECIPLRDSISLWLSLSHIQQICGRRLWKHCGKKKCLNMCFQKSSAAGCLLLERFNIRPNYFTVCILDLTTPHTRSSGINPIYFNTH